MMALTYLEELEQLVKDGKLDEALIDGAFRRILRQKFRLGLMDDLISNYPKKLLDVPTLKTGEPMFLFIHVSFLLLNPT